MMTAGQNYAVRAHPVCETRRVGDEAEAVLIFDDVITDPWHLVDCAARDTVFEAPKTGRNFYPGLLAPAPLAYVECLVRALDPHIRDTFALTGVGLAGATCNFSMVTLPAEALNVAQRLPHVDTVDPLQFAVLHYLCDASLGGTAFYRHRATGFETICEDRLGSYQTVLDRELASALPDPHYVVGDTPLFTRTATVQAAFNRVIVYRSRLLHSGQIPANAALSSDPLKGRLTANIFLNYRPRRQT